MLNKIRKVIGIGVNALATKIFLNLAYSLYKCKTEGLVQTTMALMLMILYLLALGGSILLLTKDIKDINKELIEE